MSNPSKPRSFTWHPWLRQLWQRWWGLVRSGQLSGRASRRAFAWVPIRSLSPRHRPRIERHLAALPERDRYLRFGYAATDEQIGRYVASLNFDRDEIFGVFNRRLELVAVAHLAYSVDPQWATCAEFGVSVSAHQRGKGLGAKLFAHAVMHARNQGVSLVFIHALSENVAMLKIARQAGAVVQRDGSESEAYLSLPQATLDSQISGLVQEQMADLDYQLKMQAQHFRDWLSMVQEIRQGVRDARQTARGP
ncbi:MAG: GNAT family N-acetyltransferase [Limnohabitans sp.]|jgi:GNAT superfamily N-acetyltransferase|uniref:GNAT family N-acetyltransferase n=1 Tax=Limnohabitans sp. TaxID=1907725 RepID=UPI0025E291F6|nr:GNAT family N-acetyltransferase [Limnohabitans sp.]MCO4089656.1 GNAT family N-acetyltransferase [Limnohabitans sp.]